MAGKKSQKKRVWSDDEKLSICGQARVSGVSVAQVARRHVMNTNLIHKWLRDFGLHQRIRLRICRCLPLALRNLPRHCHKTPSQTHKVGWDELL